MKVESFKIIKPASTYELPIFKSIEKGIELVEGKTLELKFVRNKKTINNTVFLSPGGNNHSEYIENEKGDKLYSWNLINTNGEVNEFFISKDGHQKDDKVAFALGKVTGDAVELIIDKEGNTTSEVSIPKECAITDGKTYLIPFVEETTETEPQEGIVIESLLDMLIEDLRFKSKEVPSRETSIAITKLEEAALWLNARTNNRIKNGTHGTNEQ